jgi:hypothetical protein
METLILTKEELHEFCGFPKAIWGFEEIEDELSKENKK